MKKRKIEDMSRFSCNASLSTPSFRCGDEVRQNSGYSNNQQAAASRQQYWQAKRDKNKRLLPPASGLLHSRRRPRTKPLAARFSSAAKGALASRSLFHKISLSDQCKSIICGTLLGAQRCLKLTKARRGAILSIRHSQTQEEYFQWKVTCLQEIASAKSVQFSAPDKNSYRRAADIKLLFQSRALDSLTDLYKITYKQKVLSIRRRWLNRLTPLSLAIWWCDNGSIIGSPPRKGVLCTDGFNEKSVRRLARYLEKVWKLSPHVGAIHRNRKYGNYSKQIYYRIWFSTEELKKWLRIILPYIPVPSMMYKTILIYNDSQFQQRWISEVKRLAPDRPQFTEAIDAYLKKKSSGSKRPP
jgi:hypothetical protein